MRPTTSLSLRASPFAVFLALVLASCATSPNALLVQISQGDDKAKSEAIVKLGEVLVEKEAAGFPFSEGDLEALGLLKDVASQDPAPMHRMQAISALGGLRRFDHTKEFIGGLESEHWGVRWKSAEALTKHPEHSATTAIVERLQHEPNKVVILALIKALAARGDRDALKGLLEVFLDPTHRFDDHDLKVHAAILRLSGKSWPITARNDDWRIFYRQEFVKTKEPGTPPTAGGQP